MDHYKIKCNLCKSTTDIGDYRDLATVHQEIAKGLVRCSRCLKGKVFHTDFYILKNEEVVFETGIPIKMAA